MSGDIFSYTTDLSRGQTIRVLCPRCGGGSKQQPTLTLTLKEDGALIWNCYRDSCPERGASQSGEYVARPLYEKPVTKPEFNGPTEPLNDEQKARIYDLWGVVDPPYWYWAPTVRRLAMSIRSPKYTHRGWVLRDIWGRAEKKAITYLDDGEEGISWYRNHVNAPCVVVEDIPSAVRASIYVNAVALCGTGIGPSRALELNEYATKPVILALDQDATATSFKWAKKYALLWGDVKVLPLEKDLKNLTEEELCAKITY